MLSERTHWLSFPQVCRSIQSTLLILLLSSAIFLPLLGSGKTLISVLLIKIHLNEIAKRVQDGFDKQLIAFLAPTKILVGQQSKYLSANTDHLVRAYTGDTKSHHGSILDNWDVDDWDQEMSQVDLMIMTPEIMRNILERKLIPLSRFDLFILDECHHAFGNDPMAAVCRYIHHPSQTHKPRILGLTASPLPCRKGSIPQKIAELERTTGCKVVAPVDSLEDLHFHVPKPQLFSLRQPTRMSGKSPFTSLSPDEITQNPDLFFKSKIPSLVYDEYKNHPNVMSSIFSARRPIAPLLHPVHFLYYNYYRIRHGQHLQEILILLNTLHAEVSTFPQLKDLETSILHLREAERKAASSPTPPLFVSDMESLIGQLSKIFCDCGLIPCLHAFLAALTTSSKGGSPSKQQQPNQVKIIQHGFVWRNENDALFNHQTLVPSIYSMSRMKRERQRRSDTVATTSCIDMSKYETLANELLCGPFLSDETMTTDPVTSLVSTPVELMLVTLFDLLAFFIFSVENRLAQNALQHYKKLLDLDQQEGSETAADGITSRTSWGDWINKLFQLKCSFTPESLIFYPGSGSVLSSQVFAELKLSEVKGGFSSLLSHALMVCQSLLDTFSADELIDIVMKTSGDDSQDSHMRSESRGKESEFYSARMSISLPKDFYQLVTLTPPINANNEINLPDGHCGLLDSLSDVKYVPENLYGALPAVVASGSVVHEQTDEENAPLADYYLLSPRVCIMLRDLLSNRTETWGNLVKWTNCGKQSSIPALAEENDNPIESEVDSVETEWAAIVFCKMRLTVLALNSLTESLIAKIAHSKLLKEMKNSSDSDKQCSLLVRCNHIIGGYHMNLQCRRLLEFKAGVFNVLFATDIAEEGLDVRSCQRVINFDLPATVKSYVQRRGRARAQNSIMLNLIPEDKTGDQIYEELLKLLRQEEEMNGYDGSVSGSGSKKKSGDENSSVGDVVKCMIGTTSEAVMATEELPLDSQFGSDTCLDLSELPVLPGTTAEDDMYRYVVQETGAVVDINNATQLLIHYCRHIPHDKYYQPDPIYWISTLTAYSFNPSGTPPGQQIEPVPSSLYQCSILLPQSTFPQIRCQVGPLVSSKLLAKSLLSLECIRKLHLYGEIDDYLQSANSRSSIQRKTQRLLKLQSAQAQADLNSTTAELGVSEGGGGGGVNGTRGNGNVARPKDENNPEAITQIDVKVTADHLECEDTFDLLSNPLYFYRFRTQCKNEHHESCVNECPTCSRYVKSMNLYGLIFHRKIPEDILEEEIDFYIRGIKIDATLELIGSKVLSAEELSLLQMFHRHILCWESSNANVSEFFLSPKDWKKSGSNAWYMTCPLGVTGYEESSPLSSKYSQEIDLIHSSDWIPFLTKCCQQTHQLITNFFQHQKNTTTAAAAAVAAVTQSESNSSVFELKYQQRPEDLYEKVFSRRGYGNIYIGCEESLEDKKFFTDVLKVVTTGGSSGGPSDGNGNRNGVAVKSEGDEQVETQEITFQEYYLGKGLVTWSEIEKMTSQQQTSPSPSSTSSLSSPQLPLIKAASLAGRLSLVQILDQVVSTSEIIEEKHSHTVVSHLLPQHCHIIGEVKWMMIGLVAPSMIWRIQSLLLAVEAREKIRQLMPPKESLETIPRCPYFAPSPVSSGDRNPTSQSQSSSEYQLPSPSLMLKALTPRLTQEILDSERLEFIGDVILKYAVSWILFCSHWKKHEGFLTRARSEIISNSYLTRRCRQVDLLQYLRGHTLSSGKQELYFSPPGRVFSSRENRYSDLFANGESHVDENSNGNGDGNGERPLPPALSSPFSLWNVNILKPVTKTLDNQVLHKNSRGDGKYAAVNMKGKRIADMMEALIGAFYESGGIDCAIGAIRGFGLWPSSDEMETLFPVSNTQDSPEFLEDNKILPTIPPDYPPQLARIALGPSLPSAVPSSLSLPDPSTPGDCFALSVSQHTVELIAQKIGYTFQNLSLLDEALTHCSVIFKPSNQRLEYLGDAVLDYATMSLLYSVLPSSSQGQLSLLKCQLLCNHHLAKIALKIRLYRHIFVMSTRLMNQLGDLEIWSSEGQLEEEEGQGEEGEGIEKGRAEGELQDEILRKVDGKFLADVMESLIGAVYIDSHCSVEAICAVVKHLEIIPKSYFE
jgi:dsRNA-specific ribonuclease/ERCC4-related helicase